MTLSLILNESFIEFDRSWCPPCWVVGTRWYGHPLYHSDLLSLAKDAKLSKYTVPSGNRTPGRRVAVHHATVAPRKLHGRLYTAVRSSVQPSRNV